VFPQRRYSVSSADSLPHPEILTGICHEQKCLCFNDRLELTHIPVRIRADAILGIRLPKILWCIRHPYLKPVAGTRLTKSAREPWRMTDPADRRRRHHHGPPPTPGMRCGDRRNLRRGGSIRGRLPDRDRFAAHADRRHLVLARACGWPAMNPKTWRSAGIQSAAPQRHALVSLPRR